MSQKRFSIKEGSSIGLSSIYTDNGEVMTQLEVLDVLIKQHKTIQTLTKENDKLKQDCLKKQKHVTHLENKIHRMRKQIKKLEVLYHYRGQEGSVDLKTESFNLKNENTELKSENKRLKDEIKSLYKIIEVYYLMVESNE